MAITVEEDNNVISITDRGSRGGGDVEIQVPARTNLNLRTMNGGEIIVEGVDLRAVSQTAANIQNATRIKEKDHRVGLEGIYVFQKGAAQPPTEGAR